MYTKTENRPMTEADFFNSLHFYLDIEVKHEYSYQMSVVKPAQIKNRERLYMLSDHLTALNVALKLIMERYHYQQKHLEERLTEMAQEV